MELATLLTESELHLLSASLGGVHVERGEQRLGLAQRSEHALVLERRSAQLGLELLLFVELFHDEIAMLGRFLFVGFVSLWLLSEI